MIKAITAAGAVIVALPLLIILLVTASTSTPAQAAPAVGLRNASPASSRIAGSLRAASRSATCSM